MATLIRKMNHASVAVSAGVESYWTVPEGIVFMEIAPQTDSDERMSWDEGGTTQTGGYFPVDPDWWSPPDFKIGAGTKLYLYSDVDNRFRIQYGIGS